MATFLALFEYDGGPYRGWQRQAGMTTVQGEVENALKTLTRQCVRIQACGRTDTGVHALAMPVSFDVIGFDANRLREGLNGLLALQPISCLDVYTMPDGFNARHDCMGRAYEYRILARRAPPALGRGTVHSIRVPLDVASMNAGAAHLIGRHDFSTFRAKDCQAASPVKTLDALHVYVRDEQIIVEAQARSFLHHQVRLMVGSLIEIGRGRWSPNRLRAALQAADPRACGPMVSPKGLYFVWGSYANLPEPGPYRRSSGHKSDQVSTNSFQHTSR